MRLLTDVTSVTVTVFSLLSIAASAPHLHGDGRYGGSLYDETPAGGLASGYGAAGSTGVSDLGLDTTTARVRVTGVSWNVTVRFRKLHGHSESSMLLHTGQHVQQPEEYEVPRRPCACEHANGDILSSGLKAAIPTTHYKAGVAEVISTSQLLVTASASDDINPVVSATTSVAACGLDAIAIFVTETVAITLTSRLSRLASSPPALSRVTAVEQPTSSSLSKPYLPALPSSGSKDVDKLQMNTLSTVIILETLTVIPLPAPSGETYQGFQQGSNDELDSADRVEAGGGGK